MAISKLADGKILCRWEYNVRNAKICKITPHQMAGKLSGKGCAQYFKNNGLENSANYCIGYDGDIWCNVLEENRAWTSSSEWNDQRAITVELSNSANGTDRMTDKTIEAFKKLAVDIALRYDIKEYKYTGDSSGSFTLHRFYAATTCPGAWFESQIPAIIKDINNRIKKQSIYQDGWVKTGGTWYFYQNGKPKKGWLRWKEKWYFLASNGAMLTGWQKYKNKWYYLDLKNGDMYTGTHKINGMQCSFDKNGALISPKKPPAFTPYTVTVSIDDLNIRTGAGTQYKSVGFIPRGVYTIVDEQANWGKLKSGKGWICLDYVTKN